MADKFDDKSDDAALKARLDKLSKSLGADEKSRKGEAPANDGAGIGNGMGAGMRVVGELVAGVVVGGGLGWLLDRWFDTKPLWMIILGCLGLIGGFWNTVRAAMLPPGSGGGRFGG